MQHDHEAPEQMAAFDARNFRSYVSPAEALSQGLSQNPLMKDHATEQAIAATNLRDEVQSRQGFCIGELCLMIRQEDGSELTEMPYVFRLPNSPDWFSGMANLHGLLTPVFDLGRYLGVSSDSAAKRMLLVISQGASAAGLVISGLPQRMQWSSSEVIGIGSAPPRLAPHISSAALIRDRIWFDLECDSLLEALEFSLQSTH